MKKLEEYLFENQTISNDNFGISVQDLIKHENHLRQQWVGSTIHIDFKYNLSIFKDIPISDVVTPDGQTKKNDKNGLDFEIPKVRKEIEHIYGYGIENMISIQKLNNKLDDIATINGKKFDLEIKSAIKDLGSKGQTPNHGKLKVSKTQIQALRENGLLLYIYYEIDDKSLDAVIKNLYLRTPDLIECSNEEAKYPSITRLRMDIYNNDSSDSKDKRKKK